MQVRYSISMNTVKTQVWTAISTHVLVAIVKREMKVELSLSEILQILSLNLFEKTPLLTLFLTQNNTMKNRVALSN